MATVQVDGIGFVVQNVTLSSTVKTAISFSQPVNSVTLQCRTAIDLSIYPHEGNDTSGTAGTVPYTLKSGGVLTLKIATGRANRPLFWVQAASTTPVLEIIGIY